MLRVMTDSELVAFQSFQLSINDSRDNLVSMQDFDHAFTHLTDIVRDVKFRLMQTAVYFALLTMLVEPEAAAVVRQTFQVEHKACQTGKYLVTANFLIKHNALHLAFDLVKHGVVRQLSRRFSTLKKSCLVDLREVVKLVEDWIEGFKHKNETAPARGQRLDKMIETRIQMHNGTHTGVHDHTVINLLVHSSALNNKHSTNNPQGSNDVEADASCGTRSIVRECGYNK
jgi:hypothetical protein